MLACCVVYLSERTDKTMTTLSKARTFNEVISDWEHGLEPYRCPADRSSDTHSGLSGMIAPVAVRLGKLLGLADFFSLSISPRFIKVCLAVVFFCLFFFYLPSNTGEENGVYVHNFITNTVEYRTAER